MLNIGTLKKTKGGGTRIYEGVVNLGRRLNGWLYLDENPKWSKDAEDDDHTPRYHVRFMPTGWRGPEMKMGAAWEMHAEKSGVDYLSFKLSDPDWRTSLHLVGFDTDDKTGDLDILWNEPKAPQADAQQVAA